MAATSETSRWRWATLTGVFVGIALRVWQYATLPSIWVDEAAVARNILDRSLSGLLEPLDYAQVAPPGFLLAVKLSTALFGISEYALRLFPLLAGTAAVALFAWVTRSTLRPVASAVATLTFSIAIPPIYYSSNLKQYSSDVAATLLVVIMAVRLHQSRIPPAALAGYAAAGGAVLFFSGAAVFALTAAGAFVAADALRSRRADARSRLVLVALWACAAAAAVAHGFASMTPADGEYMRRFWGHAFVPGDDAAGWLWDGANGFFNQGGTSFSDGSLHYRWPGLFVVLALVGAVALAIEKPLHAALLCGPVLLTLAAAEARAYPFGRRVDLFLLPLLLLLAVAGADRLGRFLTRRKLGEYASALLLPIAFTALWQSPPPYKAEHIRPVIEQISDNWRNGDTLWVYYGAGQAFEYYRRLIPIRGKVRVGKCSRGDPRDYLRQVDAARGHARVWILLSHGFASQGVAERRLIVQYLDAIGEKLQRFDAGTTENSSMRAEALLYDLSDPPRLDRVSAKTFPIRSRHPTQSWTCYGTMSPLGPNPKIVDQLTRAAARRAATSH